ncbi:MAG: tRNA (guanosine(37)-N1)-methyltransferase TrmD [Oscillospiraceae bacterium]|nr:tRNA (guanosine(37)-N1)-methyltransferase TrmD [Oscillospiraceae bacterium]
MLKFHIITLFPDMVRAVLSESIIGRGEKKGCLSIEYYQLRDYSPNKHKTVDDTPYGGGFGMLLTAAPIYNCWSEICSGTKDGRIKTIYMSPKGALLTQKKAEEFAGGYTDIIIICGHYEGVDERFIEECVDEEISMGDYVLTGGEIPACALCDAVCRLIPGVLADEECFIGESHWYGLLEYPQYSRPEVWHGRAVPGILLSGHHKNIADWRHEQSLERTRRRRPDLWEKLTVQ